MKKIVSIIALFLFSFLLYGCLEVEDVVSIEFLTLPRTTYLVGESLDTYEISVSQEGEEDMILSSNDERIVITGFNTDTVGTRTMTVTVTGFEGASVNFVYSVVESFDDLLFGGGDGSEADPYQIFNAQHLSNIRLALDKNFILMDDIDLLDVQWNPIGLISVIISGHTMTITVIQGFSGILDGNDHSIDNFTVTTTGSTDAVLQPSALFQAIEGGSVFDLTFNSPNLDVAWSASALAGIIVDSTITNVHVVDGFFSGRAPGGLANRISGNSILTNVTVDAELVGKLVVASFAYRTAGGVVVQVTPGAGNTVTFDNVHFTGTITTDWSDPDLPVEDLGKQGSYTGLLIGRVQSGGTMVITNSSVTGTIVGNTTSSHGFYGFAYDPVTGVLSETEANHSNNAPDQNIFTNFPLLTVEQRKMVGAFFASSGNALYIFDTHQIQT